MSSVGPADRPVSIEISAVLTFKNRRYLSSCLFYGATNNINGTVQSGVQHAPVHF
jgi:hypothetical protein